MRKMIVVAVREYQAAVKTKTFIISVIAMPVFMGGSIAVQGLMRDKVDTTDKTVAIWDQTGVLDEAIAEAARKRNEDQVFTGEGSQRKKVRPRFLLERVDGRSEDPTRAAFELSERVRKNELFAFAIIGPNVVEPGDDASLAGVAYHSNSPTYEDIQEWLARELNTAVQGLRFQAVKLEPDVVKKATARVPVANLGLVSLDEQGQVTKAEETNKFANFLVPLGLMMLMWMAVMMAASPLMQSVLEEKMQRIAEVLLGSISPFQLMMGKLLGIVGVSLTLVTIYLVGGFVAIRQAGYGQFFPAHVIWWFVLFQAMAVLLYGSLFAAIGAAVSDTKEAQNLMTPVMLVVVAPMFVWLNVVKEPLSTFSVVVSLFPPATPMLMVLRQAVPPGVPLWQPLLGVALVLLTTVLAIFVAGRIFRVGILMQGKGANLTEMVRWAIRG
jgi:ABC-type Na+ efflux pump permease subunit